MESNPIKFRAQLDDLPAMMQWLRECALEANFSATEIRKIELASEEALVNVIHYAYKDKPGNVTLSCTLNQDSFEIRIADEGKPFNPLAQSSSFDIESSLEDRKAGGLGIFLMRKYMDALHYERTSTSNILTLSRKVNQRKT